MTFDEWFKEHIDDIYDKDLEDLAYVCWCAGYKAGLNKMRSFSRDMIQDVYVDKPKSQV